MKNFLRTNLYYIIRLIGTQVGISIFAMMLQFATVRTDGPLFLFASIGSVAFYLVLIYSTCWEMGYKNSERVRAGRLHQSWYHGAYVSLASYAPVLLLVALLWLGFAFSSQLWAGNLFQIVKWVLYMFFSVYYGIIKTVIEGAQDINTVLYPLMYTLSVIPGIITAGIAYAMGRKGLALFSKPKANVE
ncbi:MAG: hypothetical protein IKM09_00565 [Clostridia bacterium]|nr:hypothetical protein [Clostridia bacterium]